MDLLAARIRGPDACAPPLPTSRLEKALVEARKRGCVEELIIVGDVKLDFWKKARERRTVAKKALEDLCKPVPVKLDIPALEEALVEGVAAKVASGQVGDKEPPKTMEESRLKLEISRVTQSLWEAHMGQIHELDIELLQARPPLPSRKVPGRFPEGYRPLPQLSRRLPRSRPRLTFAPTWPFDLTFAVMITQAPIHPPSLAPSAQSELDKAAGAELEREEATEAALQGEFDRAQYELDVLVETEDREKEMREKLEVKKQVGRVCVGGVVGAVALGLRRVVRGVAVRGVW